MDIRNFFGKKAPNGGGGGAQASTTTSPVVSKKKRAAKAIQDSDSDDDFISATPDTKKAKKTVSPSENKVGAANQIQSKQKEKEKEMSAKDFFGGATDDKKRKRRNDEKKEVDDVPEKKKSPEKKAKSEPRVSPKKTSTSIGSKFTPVVKEVKENSKMPRKKSENQDEVKCERKVETTTKEKKSPVKKSLASSSTSEKERTPVKATKNAHVNLKAKSSPEKQSYKVVASPIKSTPSGVYGLGQTDLWVEKYKPQNLKGIIGQQGEKSNMRKLVTWIKAWTQNHMSGGKPPPRPPPWNSGADNGMWAKAALLSGPPGVGKTTTAYLVSKELGYDVMEMNASDTRSKKLLEAMVSDATSSQSLAKTSKNRILLMDEVDGMAGNEDRGGMAELISLIKSSKIPVICMCNDRNAQKIRSLANHCFDLRFQRPRADQIKAAMMSVCFKEKIKISPDALNELIVGCNQDVRQVLHHLSMMKGRRDQEGKMDATQAKQEAGMAKKTSIKVGPFDVVRKVFSASEQRGMSLMDKSDLFFQDYSMGPLFTQENYLSVVPNAAENDKFATMELVSKAADSFCTGDLIDGTIRSKNAWSLLPVQAMFSSVIPGEYMSGYLQGKIEFPAWFGKFSKGNKFDRIYQELATHTRLKCGVSKRAMNRELGQSLRDAIVRPMIKDGAEGVTQSVEVMKEYSLLREDLDNLLEVCQWPNHENPLKNVEPKVKAAFTRLYNKEIVLPYANNTGAVGKKRAAPVVESVLDEEEDLMDADDDKGDDDDDISADTMIKAKKPSKAAASKAKANDTGKGKASAKGGKGRGKKK